MKSISYNAPCLWNDLHQRFMVTIDYDVTSILKTKNTLRTFSLSRISLSSSVEVLSGCFAYLDLHPPKAIDWGWQIKDLSWTECLWNSLWTTKLSSIVFKYSWLIDCKKKKVVLYKIWFTYLLTWSGIFINEIGEIVKSETVVFWDSVFYKCIMCVLFTLIALLTWKHFWIYNCFEFYVDSVLQEVGVSKVIKMVKTFQKYLPDECHRMYSCVHCRAHLANHDDLVSKVDVMSHN